MKKSCDLAKYQQEQTFSYLNKYLLYVTSMLSVKFNMIFLFVVPRRCRLAIKFAELEREDWGSVS